MTKVAFSFARENLTTLVNRVAFGEQKYVIERRGRQLAALVPLNYLALLEQVAREFVKTQTPRHDFQPPTSNPEPPIPQSPPPI